MKRVIIWGLLLLVAVLTTACGGGGGSGGGLVATTTAKGSFVDGPVVGLGYTCGTIVGLTGSDGSYTYRVGKDVTFHVGGVVLGTAPAAAVVTPLHFVPGSSAATPQVVNIARFLLSIGNLDPLTAVITIPAEVTAAAGGLTADFATAGDAQLLALVQAAKGDPAATLVDAAAATDHLSGCIYQAYGGVYTGTFSGPAPSQGFEFTISDTGEVVGRGINPEGEIITGRMTDGTHFEGVASGGCILVGTLDVTTGILSGTWRLPNDTTTYPFSGRRH